MSASKKRLGRGLDELFGGDVQSIINDIENGGSKNQAIEISIDEIRPNPHQPRRVFDEEKLTELASSIKEHGVFQPVILKKSAIQGYEIVAGERRVRASKLAGKTTIPAILVDFTDDQMLEIAVLENIQREDLNAIEEAQAYRHMMEHLGLTQDKLASRLGKSRTHVTNTLRLLNLPEPIQTFVLEGKLSMGHVRPLITLEKEKALEIANRAIAENLSVRDVENIIKGLELQQKRKEKPKVEKDPHYTYVEGLIRRKYRTKIKVEDHQIVIKYTDQNDLNRILETMGVIED